jgi:fibronectin type 3 domain-containing protein
MSCGVTYTFDSSTSTTTRGSGATQYPVLGFIYSRPLYRFTFPNHSSEGWTCGYDTEEWQGNDLNTWQVRTIGPNPGIISPPLGDGIPANTLTIHFSARVLDNTSPSEGYLYLKDETGSWNNPVPIGSVDTSHDYWEYSVNLASAGVRSDLLVKQFSIELTNGQNEYWALDWVNLILNPSPPANLSASATSSSQIALNWDTVAGVNSYNIYRNSYFIASTASSSYIDNGLNHDTRYTYNITSSVGGNESALSVSVSAVTYGGPTGPSIGAIRVDGPNNVRRNSQNQYTAYAVYSDGHEEDVTSSATWSLSSYSHDVDISSAGVLTTSNTPNEMYRKITATYSGVSGDKGVILQPLDNVGQTIYVPDEYPTIQQAIDNALENGQIIVRPGTYYERIAFTAKPVTLVSEAGPEVTIIDGSGDDKSTVRFGINSGNGAVLDGFTITGGSGTEITTYNWVGGGILCWQGASPTITNCIIKGNGNYRTISGGGIYCRADAAPTITNCLIIGNLAQSAGGGIYYSNATATLTNCIISGNRAYHGGGIYSYSMLLNVINCTISGNRADYGGGIYVYQDRVTIQNSIIWNNLIFLSNNNQFHLASDDDSILATYSDIQGGWPGTGNINADPLFANPQNPTQAPTANSDYHLTANSPCINAGTSSNAPFDDVDGDMRPEDRGYDIGADQFRAE